MAIVLTGLRLYPVKSLQGFDVRSATIESGRFVGDREWLLVNEQGEFMHQRDYPQMARVRAEPHGGGITLSAPGSDSIDVLAPRHGSVSHVQLWRRQAPVRWAPEDANRWLTARLGVSARLAAFAPDGEALDVPWYETNSSLQDAAAFHLTTDDSLADLNSRLPSPIPMNRFRPNVVVSGGGAYAEDGWRKISIGAVSFTWVKPCTRCVMTTTDQSTGERMGQEPLRALGTYRRTGSKVTFGHYLVAEASNGTLTVGDEARVIETA
jgi:uncharacterized protein YcbX